MADELTHRERLVALRDDLTARLPTAADSYAAAIARQLQAVLGELATMVDPTSVGESSLERIRAGRDARRAAVREAAEHTPPIAG